MAWKLHWSLDVTVDTPLIGPLYGDLKALLDEIQAQSRRDGLDELVGEKRRTEWIHQILFEKLFIHSWFCTYKRRYIILLLNFDEVGANVVSLKSGVIFASFSGIRGILGKSWNDK